MTVHAPSNPELAIMVIADADKKVNRKNVMMFFIEPNSKINIDIDTAAKEKYVVTENHERNA